MNNEDIVPGFEDETCDALQIVLRRIEELEGGLLLSLTGSIGSYNSECFVRRVTRAIDAGFIHTVRAVKSGRFRCRECRTVLAVDPAGQVFLG